MPRFDFDLAAHADRLPGGPGAYFIDHRGRDLPLVVRQADGVPLFQIEDDDTLTSYVGPGPNPAVPAVTAQVASQLDPAKLRKDS